MSRGKGNLAMSKYYLLGWMFIVGAVVMVIYQAIASTMTAGDIIWKELHLTDIVDPKYLAWAEGFSYAQLVIGMPLFLLMIAVGMLLIIVGAIIRRW